MHIKRKTAAIFIYTLLSISFVSQVPSSSGIYFPFPFSRASIYSSNETDEFINYFGHDLNERYWSLIYDFAGDYVVQDYNPMGPYVLNRTIGNNDSINHTDANFFMAWNNLQNVHNFYFAMQNYTWNQTEDYFYGSAPYQYYLQHFVIPLTNTHVFTLNKFLGLLAYEDNSTEGIEGIPDENDSLFMGWPQFSEYHKYIINILFEALSVPQEFWINNETRSSAHPLKMTHNESTNTYEFGMSYQNLFILWQKLELEYGLNESLGQDIDPLLNNCTAFSIISNINFTFRISIENSLLGKKVITTTEYDIGELTDLWMIGDNQSIAESFGGSHFNLSFVPDSDFGYYNTSSSIGNRLNGTSSIPGFGLAVINSANIAVVKMKSFFGLFSYPESVGIEHFIDEDGEILGNSTQNITQAGYNQLGQKVYNIDFASKPNYLWNGTNKYEAPTRVLANNAVKTNITGLIDSVAYGVIYIFILQSIGHPLSGLLTADMVLDQFLSNEFYYLTCFPIWAGSNITQDPIFNIYVPNPIFDLPGGESEQPRNRFLFIIGSVCIIFLIAIVIVLSRKAYIKYIKNRAEIIDTGSHRLTLEEVLENENRKSIIDAILAEPGIHFNDLLRKTELAPGNLVWHLDILETYKIIKKKRVGNYLIFIPYYSKNPLSNIDLKLQKSELTLKVLEMIEENPGIWNKKLTNELNIHRKTIQYHIDKLLELGLVYRQKDGSKKRIYPNLEMEYFKDNI